ncbi:MAG TPA: type II toxin-antitoxin system HipA family toxin [Mycobacterium sp.]|nr:type II toxin-antitoxin system HipA family toxin [Mycobacterium sp.]HPZ94305.1 type II toxin-antitoxin system HipA family toxin [Mycobacterium sp.]HQE15412.1 type II toxin-antitoxin system HipA family toxin [Mycobacterium sp.]
MTSPGLKELRDVAQADVYVGDDLVARLTRTRDEGIRFDYLDDSGASAGPVRGRSVAWSLLRSADHPVSTKSAAVPPFFAGLLPEGDRLSAVAAATGTSAGDHLTLLLAVGADTVGNVRVVAAGTTPAASQPLFDPDRDDDFRAVFDRVVVGVDPTALAGNQPKVSARMPSAPGHGPGGPAILKLNPQRYPRLVENEQFFMTMAAACGIRAAQTSLIQDTAGRSALLIERFDRVGHARIAQEDACQVAAMYPASKYRITTETALLTLADACARGGGSRIVTLAELFKTVVFAWLIGNGELHGKNLSIHHADGLWQPTPAYDLLCTQVYTGWNDPMALTFFGRASMLSRTSFIDSGQRLGIRKRAVLAMIDEIVDGAGAWPDRCEWIGFDDRQTATLTRWLRSRIKRLKGGR